MKLSNAALAFAVLVGVACIWLGAMRAGWGRDASETHDRVTARRLAEVRALERAFERRDFQVADCTFCCATIDFDDADLGSALTDIGATGWGTP